MKQGVVVLIFGGLLALLSPHALAVSAQGLSSCELGYLNSVALIADDMRLPHEAAPQGVPSNYDWSAMPRLGYGEDMPADWSAFITWGQVYKAAEGSSAINTRVQIRDIEAYVLDASTGRWELLQFDRLIEGAAYVEDFVENASIEADVREEADGSISIALQDGYNFHFWPASGRVTLDASDIGGIFTTVQARLIVDDPTLPDDREQARFLMSIGADYWRALDSEWQADWSANGDVGIGRFRYITNEWQSFNMSTLSSDRLCDNPPPLR